MRKIIYGLFMLVLVSCAKDESIDINSDKLKLTYRGYLEEITGQDYKNITFSIIKINSIIEKISQTEELNLLQIEANSSGDDRFILIKVYPNKTGNNVLYNNVFDFRTPEGTPYSASSIDFQVLTNNEEEFSANFSGMLKHYNQNINNYIYLDIKAGSVTIKY